MIIRSILYLDDKQTNLQVPIAATDLGRFIINSRVLTSIFGANIYPIASEHYILCYSEYNDVYCLTNCK